jgi:hypothetical protein
MRSRIVAICVTGRLASIDQSTGRMAFMTLDGSPRVRMTKLPVCSLSRFDGT